MDLVPHIRWPNAPYNNDILIDLFVFIMYVLNTILERKRIPWSIFPDRADWE